MNNKNFNTTITNASNVINNADAILISRGWNGY